MYSYEIDNKLKSSDYIISGEEYIHIFRTSPQITHVKFSGFTQEYEMSTADNYHWHFIVHNI